MFFTVDLNLYNEVVTPFRPFFRPENVEEIASTYMAGPKSSWNRAESTCMNVNDIHGNGRILRNVLLFGREKRRLLPHFFRQRCLFFFKKNYTSQKIFDIFDFVNFCCDNFERY